MRPQLVIGRWRLVEVEYLPSDDDGGFADEGEGDVMSAGALGLDDGFLEFAGDGTFRGQYWGPEEGTWRIDGGKVSFDLTADAPGDWAFHCHLLLHMHAGMFRVVTVRPLDGDAA